jgi:hypothetical protein
MTLNNSLVLMILFASIFSFEMTLTQNNPKNDEASKDKAKLVEQAAKIQELEAVVRELQTIKNVLIERLSNCQQRLNFSQMTIQNTGASPCFNQDVKMN